MHNRVIYIWLFPVK